MASRYDHWKAGDFDADDCARDEAIAERATELYGERITDDARVQDAIDDMIGNDYDGFFAARLRRFYIAFDAAQTDSAMAEAAYALFQDLQPMVESTIRDDAGQDAVREREESEEGTGWEAAA